MSTDPRYKDQCFLFSSPTKRTFHSIFHRQYLFLISIPERLLTVKVYCFDFANTSSTIPYSLASSAVIQLSRSLFSSICSNVLSVCLARIVYSSFRSCLISL